jgi:hypothetical protein
MIRKILIATAAAALMSTPAWALPGQTPADQGTHGNSGEHRNSGKHPSGPAGNHGDSHKCKPHKVGYVAGGALVSEKLEKNADGTYSGELEVEVTRTNHHASADKGHKVTYTLSDAHVVFGMEDTNKDGSVGLDDLAPGDRTHVIGKITALAPKCPHGEFTATKTIKRVVFHAPATSAS